MQIKKCQAHRTVYICLDVLFNDDSIVLDKEYDLENNHVTVDKI